MLLSLRFATWTATALFFYLFTTKISGWLATSRSFTFRMTAWCVTCLLIEKKYSSQQQNQRLYFFQYYFAVAPKKILLPVETLTSISYFIWWHWGEFSLISLQATDFLFQVFAAAVVSWGDHFVPLLLGIRAQWFPWQPDSKPQTVRHSLYGDESYTDHALPQCLLGLPCSLARLLDKEPWGSQTHKVSVCRIYWGKQHSIDDPWLCISKVFCPFQCFTPVVDDLQLLCIKCVSSLNVGLQIEILKSFWFFVKDQWPWTLSFWLH